MKNWALKYFNREILPENCIILAGTTKDDLKNDILSNYEANEELHHCLFEAYECSSKEANTLVIFQIYSAVMIADLLHYLNDGGVRNIIFIGAAFSFYDRLNIGDIVVPDIVKPMDGLVDYIEDMEIAIPSAKSLMYITELLKANSINYIQGKAISVPGVFVKPKNMISDNDYITMEMECASLYHYSNKLGINSVAMQIISDKKNHQLYDSQKARYESIQKILRILSKEKKFV